MGGEKSGLGKIINRNWINRNLVAIVIIPTIIAIHYGWSSLQNNKALVAENEKKGQPIVEAAKLFYDKMTGKSG